MHRSVACLFLWLLPCAAGLPDWLSVYPGATAETITAPGVVTSTYIAAAKPDAVIAHYGKLWTAAGLPFAANFNGIGTSIRAALTDCDLLVQIREEGEGSHVKASCAARNQAPDASAGREVISSNGSSSAARHRQQSLQQLQMARAKSDAHTAAVLAQAEADGRARTRSMGQYDRPVFPQQPRDPEGIPLQWPAWLVHMPGASTELAIKPGKDQGGRNILTSTFRTTRPMSEVHIFYEDLMKANGFPVGQSRLQTGQTLGGVMQNANGMVNGRYEPYGVARGGMSVEARFYRGKLDEPIRVTLEVTLIQYYPRR